MEELKDYLIFRDYILPAIIFGVTILIYCIYWFISVVKSGYKKNRSKDE